MRAAILAAIAAVAVAAPAPVVTITEVVDVTHYVYEDGTPVYPEETEAPKYDGNGYHHWGPPKDEPAAPAPAPYTPAPEPVAEPAAPAPAPEAPSSYVGAGQPTSGDYATAVIQHHNAHRANHSAPDIVWDAGLASTAQKIGQSCVYAHDTSTDGGGYGQNIAAGADASAIASVITDLFYNNEIGNFNEYGAGTPSSINDHEAFNGWGHFTQIVWKGSTKVGCATVDCSGRGLANTGGSVPPHFTVCNYAPAGNFLGEFAENVGRPLGYPGITSGST